MGFRFSIAIITKRADTAEVARTCRKIRRHSRLRMKNRAWEIVAAARPKKIDARILVNPATGMIYTSRRLSAEWKPYAQHEWTTPRLPVQRGGGHFSVFSAEPRVKNHVLIPSRGFEAARRRSSVCALSPRLSSLREPKTAKLNDLGISVVSDKNTRKLVINYVIKTHSKRYKISCTLHPSPLPPPPPLLPGGWYGHKYKFQGHRYSPRARPNLSACSSV